MKVTGKMKMDQMNVKRFYMPGVVVEDNCSHCGAECKIEMESHYPYAIKEDGMCDLSYNCDSCEESTDRVMQLSITISPKT